MAEKKKAGASKVTDRRMSKPQVSRTPVKSNENRNAEPAKPSQAQVQLGNFEAAMKQFHARSFKEARALFEKAAAGPERDVANRARLHISMCERRLEQTKPAISTAEEHYNYGIALLNTRKIQEARGHLEQALKMSPGADHIHYALALAQALDGDITSAHENLRRAIELEPRNRLLARQDTDFAPLANHPPFDALIYPERKGW
jgi:tetratricopeptide (TPR) repeat protein